MKLAITVWNERVAPVFDAAECCLLLTPGAPEKETLALPTTSYEDKADFLSQNGVTTLICGAISCECEEAVIGQNIEVVSFIAGPVDQVIAAWNENRLIKTEFSMPGCGCPRRRRRRNGCHHKSLLNL